MALSDRSGTRGEKSDSSQVFPDYSQLVPDRTATSFQVRPLMAQLNEMPISHIMSSNLHRIAWRLNDSRLLSPPPPSPGERAARRSPDGPHGRDLRGGKPSSVSSDVGATGGPVTAGTHSLARDCGAVRRS